MNKRLSRKFFDRPTLVVAQELLGKFLVRKIGNKKVEVMITETEAYFGHDDLASHAARGRTKRTEIMFGEPALAYVYMIYGMYFCLNFVTEKKDFPAAVLIRGGENVNGPGRLCRNFKIDKKLNGEDIVKSNKLWVEDRGITIKPSQIKKSKRIGIHYAQEYQHKLWRFYLDVI